MITSLDGLDFLLRGRHQETIGKKSETEATALISKSQRSESVGESADVPLKDVVSAYKTSVSFKLAVFTSVAHTTGQGFFVSTDKSTSDGEKAAEIIDAFDDEWDIDMLNQKIGRDVWSSGNAFLNAVGDDAAPIQGIFMLPLSSFKRVKRTVGGDILSFVQIWSGRKRELPPGAVLHFPWMPLDESAFGEGMGQILLREGTGYETEAGNTVKRESWISAMERIDDSSIKMVYSGLPRYYAFFDDEDADEDFINSTNTKLNKLDPLQHFVTNMKGSVQTISLDTQNRFDSFIRNISDKVIQGTMSPLARLWSNLDFTFASAKEATKEMFPMFSMYQRAHKRFMMKAMIRPLLEQEGVNLREANPLWNWGAPEALTFEQIKQIWEILKDPAFIDKFQPEDVIDMLNEAGAKLSPPTQQEMREDSQTLNKLISRRDKGRTHIRYEDLPESIKHQLAIKSVNATTKNTV